MVPIDAFVTELRQLSTCTSGAKRFSIASTPDLRVPLQVGSEHIDALVDTGATLCTILASFARQAGLTIQPAPFELTARAADGHPLSAVGLVSGVLVFPGTVGRTFPFTAIALEALPEKFLIGRHFLWEHSANINMRNGTMTLLDADDAQNVVAAAPVKTFHHDFNVRGLATLLIQSLNVPQNPESLEQRQRRAIRTRLDELKKDCKKLEALLFEFRDVVCPEKLGTAKCEPFTIELQPDAKPFKAAARRFPHDKLPKIAAAIKDLLDRGWIRPSKSAWAHRLVPVGKKDGTIRLCVDYGPLNQVTIDDAYPSPLIDLILDQLCGRRYFSKFDAEKGDYQILLAMDCRHLTAFSCPMGLFEFVVMPFGLRNAVAYFQRMMNELLGESLHTFNNVLLDDILTASFEYNEHLRHLRFTLTKLREGNVTLNLAKCFFASERLVYLGYTVDSNGLSPDPEKVSAVLNWIAPTTKTQLRSFIGVVQFLRRFIPKCAEILQPLTDLTSDEFPKDISPFWKDTQETAFTRLKKALTETPVLAHPDWEKSFVLETDASNYAVSGVLMQVQHDNKLDKEVLKPIAYFSRKLNKAQRSYDAPSRECLAIVASILHFDHYLNSRRFTVVSDHWAHQTLMTRSDPHHRLDRWRQVLSHYSFSIKYRKGVEHVFPDALSRLHSLPEAPELPSDLTEIPYQERFTPCEPLAAIGDLSVNVIETAENIATAPVSMLRDDVDKNEREQWMSAQRADERLGPLVTCLTDPNAIPSPKYRRWVAQQAEAFQLIEGLLYRVSVVVLDGQPSTSTALAVPAALRDRVLSSLHDCLPDGAHLGVKLIYPILRKFFWWSGMFADLKSHVEACIVCQQYKKGREQKPQLQPYSAPDAAWEVLAIDNMRLPLTADGFCYTLVCIECYTGFAIAFPLKDIGHNSVVRALLDGVFTKYGWPKFLIADNGSEFNNQYIVDLCESASVHRRAIAPYNPKSNARPERFNRVLSAMLSATLRDDPDWPSKLASVVDVYNRAAAPDNVHSRFYLALGREPVPAIYQNIGISDNNTHVDPDAAKVLSDYAAFCNHALQERRRKAERDRANATRDEPETLSPGRLVWLFDNVTQEESKATTRKLAAQRTGLFVIMAAVNDPTVTYHVRPLGGRDIFTRNAKDITPYVAPADEPNSLKRRLLVDASEPTPERTVRNRRTTKPIGEQYVVEKVLNHRWTDGELYFQVKWVGYPVDEATWEPELNLNCPLLVQQYYKLTLPLRSQPAKSPSGTPGP